MALDKIYAPKKVSRILWAVDPFETDITLDQDTLEDFAKWAKENKLSIEPVYIFTPFGEIEKMASDKIAEKIIGFFSRLNISVCKPNILIRSMDSTKRQATILLDHARQTDTDLIVVSSHGRQGLSRMLFGSFAESLLNSSHLPLLFLNRNQRPIGSDFQRVLWATDFSKVGKFAFDAFLTQTTGLCKQVNLFNDISLPFEMRTYFAQWDVGIPPMDDIIESQSHWAKHQCAAWGKFAEKKGFKVETAVEMGHARVSSEILAAARENASGMIAMASQAGPVGSVLMGSQARDVFRASEFPVWIYGPQFCEIAKNIASHQSQDKKTSDESASTPCPAL